ncbi:ISL3 family transposase [Candidatus Woesearchaeota archaeon CG_4_10_14_0_8_um_filter_47_5]|nr:MAG: ISL3 family transposase [Candidatus Woesearchaeota archaeon CG_4_10_14_0_8_um_filter_47_5]
MEILYLVLRNMFPYKGYKLSVLENGNHILIGLKSRRKCGICPTCGKHCRNVETEYERTVRDLDLAQRQCYLLFKQKKLRCSCGYRGLEKLDFVSKSRRVTTRMETYVVSLAEKMSLKEVAEIVRLDWKTIKNINREYIRSLLPNILRLDIKRIAIDEIAIMKGHKYFTIIRDYDTGVAIKILFGRTYEETAKALASLGQEKLAKILYASLDMWDPYIRAIKEQCPNAELVFDKFHVVKKVNEALDSVRKKEFANAEPDERINMKHKRFVILKREENLNQKQKEELNMLMQSNEKLYKAYLLKEQVLSIFDDKTSTFAQIIERFDAWFSNILSNEMKEFYAVVDTIRHYFYGILNYFRYGMTNAIAEGFNTKVN